MELIFATHNPNKRIEIQALLPDNIVLKSLDEVGINESIPEVENTIKANALAKARYVFKKLRTACFADDTGLEVEALDNAPGVYSARYAGEHKSDADNIQKLLAALENSEHRNARFVTWIAYISGDGTEHLFEGICAGSIGRTPIGYQGFGYDPIFYPKDAQLSFAQMDISQKNKYSHRAKAFKLFCDFITKRTC
ncbi:MAG: RdgB/HAM1 family non-canonical purine NTP pyrophosphatase [Flavobacteriaceae bacterium]|nr:RdgB/HAM1 family non-canonical purine NTP pyrophosphatase [Flavobacteriaceae bacterium]